MDNEDATTIIYNALHACSSPEGYGVHWVNNTDGTLRVTFEDGTVATVTVEVSDS